MHAETRHTAIPERVKASVEARDGGSCILCGAPGLPCCHVVRRSQGGRGDTERNIVTLCWQCHRSFDEGASLGRLKPLGLCSRRDVEAYIQNYMKGCYPGWTPESVTYRKWGQ